MKDSKVILCTGGIGSGKSFVVGAFSYMGIPSYDCDARAKALYDCCPELASQVALIAGNDTVINGNVDRKALADKIFQNQNILARIEGVVYPLLKKDFLEWKEAQPCGPVVIESAIMLQKREFDDLYDFVLLVTAPREDRIERVMVRDGVSREEAIRRMDLQREFPERADYIIETNDRQPIIPAVIEIIQKLKNGKDRS